MHGSVPSAYVHTHMNTSAHTSLDT
jgi:hypothetical protein